MSAGITSNGAVRSSPSTYPYRPVPKDGNTTRGVTHELGVLFSIREVLTPIFEHAHTRDELEQVLGDWEESDFEGRGLWRAGAGDVAVGGPDVDDCAGEIAWVRGAAARHLPVKGKRRKRLCEIADD